MSLPIKLQSQVSEKINVRFYNFSNVEADVIWINYQGNHEKYCTLKPRQFIDINTFSRHYWIFMEKNTSKVLVANNQSYFLAEEQKYPHQTHSKLTRYCVCVTRALVPALKTIVITHLLNYLKNCADVKHLEIPKTLKREIIIKLHGNNSIHSNSGENISCLKNLEID